MDRLGFLTLTLGWGSDHTCVYSWRLRWPYLSTFDLTQFRVSCLSTLTMDSLEYLTWQHQTWTVWAAIPVNVYCWRIGQSWLFNVNSTSFNVNQWQVTSSYLWTTVSRGQAERLYLSTSTVDRFKCLPRQREPWRGYVSLPLNANHKKWL